MFICQWSRYPGTVSHVFWVYRRMSQEVAEGRCFPFMPLPWIIGRDALCQVDRGGQLPSKPAIIIIREAAALFSRFFFSVSEMFIYATDSPKDTEEPLLQVVTAQPPHIIHFLYFNLVVPFLLGGGKTKKSNLFWSLLHPAVKHVIIQF